MVSARKLAANRANAQKSTGPKTAAGKARSSRNGTTHGLSGDLVLDPAERRELARQRRLLNRHYEPRDDRERALVEEIALALVVLGRIERIDGEGWARAAEEGPGVIPETVGVVARHEPRWSRRLHRAIRELARAIKARLAPGRGRRKTAAGALLQPPTEPTALSPQRNEANPPSGTGGQAASAPALVARAGGRADGAAPDVSTGRDTEAPNWPTEPTAIPPRRDRDESPLTLVQEGAKSPTEPTEKSPKIPFASQLTSINRLWRPLAAAVLVLAGLGPAIPPDRPASDLPHPTSLPGIVSAPRGGRPESGGSPSAPTSAVAPLPSPPPGGDNDAPSRPSPTERATERRSGKHTP